MPVTINGDGLIEVGGTSSTQGRVRLSEDTDNGSNYVELTAPASVTANRTVTFPDADGTVLTTGAVVTVAQGGTGASSLNANSVLLGNGTSAVQVVAPGANGNVLTSNGTTWTSAAASGFPAGTAMLFVQTAAPTGWTKSTTHNDKALRVVSGAASSGGTTAFSTVFANQTPTISNTLSVGSTTLTTTQMPSHTHTVSAYSGCGGTPGIQDQSGGNLTRTVTSSATGGGGSHNHSISGGITSSAITLNVQYVDVIIATKN